jgi:Holliday junction resolvase RusA-like endonuclease
MINAKLPSLNEYINVCRRNKYQAAKFKRDVEEVIGWAIIEAKAKKMLQPTCKPCKVAFEWHERTAKRDCDNIASAKKYILDALQKQGIIPNDNQKYIKGFTDDFVKDTKDFVIVKLIEVEE